MHIAQQYNFSHHTGTLTVFTTNFEKHTYTYYYPKSTQPLSAPLFKCT